MLGSIFIIYFTAQNFLYKALIFIYVWGQHSQRISTDKINTVCDQKESILEKLIPLWLEFEAKSTHYERSLSTHIKTRIQKIVTTYPINDNWDIGPPCMLHDVAHTVLDYVIQS